MMKSRCVAVVALLFGVLPMLGRAQTDKAAAPSRMESSGSANALDAYLAKLQAQPPPAPPPDKKFGKALHKAADATLSGRCKVLFSLLQRDSLGNVYQGFTPEELEWFENKVQKKYLDICYAPPAPEVRLVFVVTVREDVYRSSVAVPYSFPYGIYTMSLMEPSKTRTWVGSGKDIRTLHVFQQRGIYHAMYGIRKFGWGKGKHPIRTLIQEAMKWIAAGGLSGPLQSYSRPNL